MAMWYQEDLLLISAYAHVLCIVYKALLITPRWTKSDCDHVHESTVLWLQRLSVLCMMIQEYTQVESTNKEQVPIETRRPMRSPLHIAAATPSTTAFTLQVCIPQGVPPGLQTFMDKRIAQFFQNTEENNYDDYDLSFRHAVLQHRTHDRNALTITHHCQAAPI
jgi:hypothetical protein